MSQPSAILLSYTCPTRLEHIGELADVVQQTLGERYQPLVYKINFCLEEIMTNTIVHGHGRAEHGQIEVTISATDAGLDVTVRDDAPEFNMFLNAPKPDLTSDLEHRPIGGLGVYLTQKLASHCQYERHDGINTTSLHFALADADAK